MSSSASAADERAAEAERSVEVLFAGRLLGMPGTRLARVAHPARRPATAPWHYWWQAHYLDCVVDSGLRLLRSGDVSGARMRARRGARLLLTIRLRNLGRYGNRYYDDMAWLALANGRLAALFAALDSGGVPRRLLGAQQALTASLRSAVTDELGGGAYWNTARDFKNVPATGPLALHLARLGETDAARRLVAWLYDRLLDPSTGLFLDGIRVDGHGEHVVRDLYTYNQGAVLAALVTLGDTESLQRAADLVGAVDRHLTGGDPPMLRTHGGHDGGLFTGILVRYLALAARTANLDPRAGASARRLVVDTASGFWTGRIGGAGATTFSDDPARPAGREDVVELSTQLQAWMILEAAAATSDFPGYMTR